MCGNNVFGIGGEIEVAARMDGDVSQVYAIILETPAHCASIEASGEAMCAALLTYPASFEGFAVLGPFFTVVVIASIDGDVDL